MFRSPARNKSCCRREGVGGKGTWSAVRNVLFKLELMASSLGCIADQDHTRVCPCGGDRTKRNNRLRAVVASPPRCEHNGASEDGTRQGEWQPPCRCDSRTSDPAMRLRRAAGERLGTQGALRRFQETVSSSWVAGPGPLARQVAFRTHRLLPKPPTQHSAGAGTLRRAPCAP